MTNITKTEIRLFLEKYISQKLHSQGRTLDNILKDDCDILLEGYIDSLGLLELTGALEEYVGVEIDFEALDPEQMTIVGSLCRFVSAQINNT